MPFSDVKRVLMAVGAQDALLIRGLLQRTYGPIDTAYDYQELVDRTQSDEYGLIFVSASFFCDDESKYIGSIAKRTAVIGVVANTNRQESLQLKKAGCLITVSFPVDLTTFKESVALAKERGSACSLDNQKLGILLKQLEHDAKSMGLDQERVVTLLNMAMADTGCAHIHKFLQVGVDSAVRVQKRIRAWQLVSVTMVAFLIVSIVCNVLQFSSRSTGYTDLQIIGAPSDSNAARK